MAVEYINRITIKKDGVYVSSKSSNCSESYKSSKIDSLTEIYNNGGQEALDKELIYMFYKYARPMGTHPSIITFKNLPNYLPYKVAFGKMIDKINYTWDHISEQDRKSIWNKSKTKGAEDYIKKEKEFEKEFLDKVYDLYVKIKQKENTKWAIL